MKHLLLFLLAFSLTASAQAANGDYLFSKVGSDGKLTPVYITPQNSTFFGINSSGQLVMMTASGGTWDSVTGKPSTFPPSTHGHTINDVTGLQSTLDAKAGLVTTGTPQVTTLDFGAIDFTDLTGNYFILPGPSITHLVWFEVDASGSAPSPPGDEETFQVTLVTSQTNAEAATATATALNDLPDFNATGTGTVVTITAVANGPLTAAENVNTELTIASTQGTSVTSLAAYDLSLGTGLPQAGVTGLTSALSAKQPLDADLTAIADLTTTSTGRNVLTAANAAGLRTMLELGTLATLNSVSLTSNVTDVLRQANGGTGQASLSNVDAADLGSASAVIWNAALADGSGGVDWRPVRLSGEATVASAATVNLAAQSAGVINITGTTTITSLGAVAAGEVRTLVFGGALTLTHNATSLIIPGGANLTTAAGDRIEVRSLGGGNWAVSPYLIRLNRCFLIGPLELVGTGFDRQWRVANAGLTYRDSIANRFSFVEGNMSLRRDMIIGWSDADPSSYTPALRLYRPSSAAGVLAIDGGGSEGAVIQMPSITSIGTPASDTARLGVLLANGDARYATVKESGLLSVMPGTLHTNVTAVSDDGSGEEIDLMSYTLPANTLAANGDTIVWTIGLDLTHASADVTAAIYLASTPLAFVGTNSGSSRALVEVQITRTSATSGIFTCSLLSATGPPAATMYGTISGDLTETWAISKIIKVTGLSITGGTRQILNRVEYHPAP